MFQNCLSNINRDEEELRQNPKKTKMDKLRTLNGKAKNLLDNMEYILGLLYNATNCEDYHVCMESSVGFDQVFNFELLYNIYLMYDFLNFLRRFLF